VLDLKEKDGYSGPNLGGGRGGIEAGIEMPDVGAEAIMGSEEGESR
jgi:hypothetical protein